MPGLWAYRRCDRRRCDRRLGAVTITFRRLRRRRRGAAAGAALRATRRTARLRRRLGATLTARFRLRRVAIFFTPFLVLCGFSNQACSVGKLIQIKMGRQAETCSPFLLAGFPAVSPWLCAYTNTRPRPVTFKKYSFALPCASNAMTGIVCGFVRSTCKRRCSVSTRKPTNSSAIVITIRYRPPTTALRP